MTSRARTGQPRAHTMYRHCEARSGEAIQSLEAPDCFAPKGARNDVRAAK